MLSKKDKIIINACREGSRVVAKYFGKHLKAYKKTTVADFFTKADIEAEERIISRLKKHFPSYNIMAEESGYMDESSDYTFVIDPLDGTNNFALGVPYFSVAVALVHKDASVFSCVYSPITNDLYYAKKGRGAWKNRQRIKVSGRGTLAKSTIALFNGYSTAKRVMNTLSKELYDNHTERVLDDWCPTLDFCLMASGQVDCILAHDDDIYEPIIGKLFIREAGGVITDYHGRAISKDDDKAFIAVNNRRLLKQVLNVIN